MQVLAASFTQHYTPVADNVLLSALVAALPIVVLLGLLGLLRVKAHLAALAGLVASLLVAMVVFGMPVKTAVGAATNGAAFGLFPIGWIVLCAIFVYDITVKTGKFEEVRRTIAGLAVDRRIQLQLIAFSFGAFIEGAAGFGTPIAICAAMLIGLGSGRCRRLAGADRQHRAGGLRRHRHPDHHPGQRHRPAARGPVGDGRPPAAVLCP